MFKHKGKIDRAKENDDKKQRPYYRIKLNPRSATEKIVHDLHQEISNLDWREPSLPPGQALNHYLQCRESRHDIWVDFMNETCAHRGVVFGDINVRRFFVDELGIPDIPTEIVNKTPDILFRDTLTGNIVLGDVTVSKSIEGANRRKHIKYLPIEDEFKRLGFTVQHINFVVEESLSNINATVDQFIRIGVLVPNKEVLVRAIEYHHTCQRTFEEILKVTADVSQFIMLLDEVDRVDPQDDDIILPDCYKNVKMEHYIPNMPEEEIIGQIYNETEKLYNDGYFDLSMDDVTAAFKKLEEKNRTDDYRVPKSTLKVVYNTHHTEPNSGYDLISDYVKDINYGDNSMEKDYLLSLLPSTYQCSEMDTMYQEKVKFDIRAKKIGKSVYGAGQYDINRSSNNYITSELRNKLLLGKKSRNEKRAPKTLNPDLYDEYTSDVDRTIQYLGKVSNKEPFLDESWDSSTNFEVETSKSVRDIYNYAKTTNGAQLCHAMSNLYQKLMHLRTSAGSKDNIYVPPSGAFIVIIPREHSPISERTCDLPFIFITRVHKDDPVGVNHLEYEHYYETSEYHYVVSKLSRHNINKINHWDQAGYKLVADTTYILATCPDLLPHKEVVVGTIAMYLLDGHQKTSEYLDLLKYISFMPFAEVSRLNKLIEEKFDLLLKTRLDVWTLKKLQSFIMALTKVPELDPKKPKLHMFNGTVTRDSLGMHMEIPSFLVNSVNHKSVASFIEEISMVYIVRPKHLYGSQFMDKSITSTIQWDIDYQKEIDEYGGWITEGIGKAPYPFNAKFGFSSDAIYYAQKYAKEHIPINPKMVLKKLNRTLYHSYMHHNCSLRGLTKDKKDRKNNIDIHTTSMEGCLKYYQATNYDEESAKPLGIINNFKKTDDVFQFSMSEKEQRGGGRPIATPTLAAKAGLMLIEKPEQAIGSHMPNNILVEGKHKLKEQSNAYKRLISSGATRNFKKVYQLTEDQSKFSEQDNINKYKTYIQTNPYLPINIRIVQIEVLKELKKREHLVHKLPKLVSSSKEYSNHRNDDKNGIKVKAGWPQGMLNNISTSVHSIADYWITYAFNKKYPNTPVLSEGLVHSDDSWVAVACDDLNTFKKFVIFRMCAKRMFCLKLNDKKVWGSKYLGELVSNFNVNGTVHMTIGKTLANSFGNLIYQNWVMDVNAQVSCLQQCYRNGAKLPVLMMMSTVLRQQICDSYQINGKQKEMMSLLPIELGGYPSVSVFELCTNGVNGHYLKILEYCKTFPTSRIYKIVLRCLRLSQDYSALRDRIDVEAAESRVQLNFVNSDGTYKIGVLSEKEKDALDADYANISIPSRGDMFTCVKHILPKSARVTHTINRIKNIPFTGTGLEMLITRPNNLKVALGDLKAQLNTRLYELASEHYTQNSRRLAISQALQSSGKTVMLLGFRPMTINELIDAVEGMVDYLPADVDKLDMALGDDNDISPISHSIVHTSEYVESGTDKRKVINTMPRVMDKFTTISKLKNVLLRIVDLARGKSLLFQYGEQIEPIDLIDKDVELIKRRFDVIFRFYTCEYAVNYIMQQYYYKSRARLWMQPHLTDHDLTSFLEDLYGKTIDMTVNYQVWTKDLTKLSNTDEQELVNSIYTVTMFNRLYEGKFKIDKVDGISLVDRMYMIDYQSLDSMTYLKLGILMHEYANDDRFIKDYDRRKMYDQRYIKSQEYTSKGYQGPFIVLVRYGKTIVKIEGEPENVKLTVNRCVVPDILLAMERFVKINFKYYQYEHHSNWSRSPFWNARNKIGNNFLTSYHANLTLITQSYNASSIPLAIDANLYMEESVGSSVVLDYEVSKDLREVYKIIPDSRVKVGSVHQQITCYANKRITLEPELIDGFDNQILLDTNLITHLTARRYQNCTFDSMEKVMRTRLANSDVKPIIDFYALFSSKFMNLGIMLDQYLEPLEEDITTYNLTGENVVEIVSRYEMTDPEDLEYIEMDYVFEDTEDIGKFTRHWSLYRTIARLMTKSCNTLDIICLLSMLMEDSEVMDKVYNDLNLESDQMLDKLDGLYNTMDLIDVSGVISKLIVAYNLDTIEGWKMINLHDILNNPISPYKQEITALYKIFKKELLDVCFECTPKDYKSMLLDKLANN